MSDLQDRLLKAAQQFEVDKKTCGVSILLEAKNAKALLRQIRKKLRDAYDEDKLSNPHHEIDKHVQLATEIPEGSGGTHAIVGGIKDLKRRPESARLCRYDEAWIHFTLTIRQRTTCVELLGYDFEIVLPKGGSPKFLRFDLNFPGHNNDLNEIRSHFHPGNDDLQAPAPVLTPSELLDLLLWKFHPRDPNKPRGTTPEESDEPPVTT